jgi:hypothetical protein
MAAVSGGTAGAGPEPATGVVPEIAGSTNQAGSDVPVGGARRRSVPGWLIAGVIYLALGVAMWWHVWTGHPSSTMVCACGDPSSIAWFMEWPAYAISHGHSLFHSGWQHAPTGLNLLDNTSVIALGVLLAPVTWLFGPIASLNVALTLAPALTALSAYGCLRRGLDLARPAAFLGGLAFGFSPFIMRNEAFNHLQVTFLPLVPLIFLCCYELAITQRGKWWRWAALLGALVTAQFFVGVELLTITAIMLGFGLLIALVVALRQGGLLAARWPFAWRGFAVAGGVSFVLLGYPLWYALKGPDHIKGVDWQALKDNGLKEMLLPLKQANLLVTGYLGPGGARGAYLGFAALIVVLIALLLVRKPLVYACAILLVIAAWLSLGVRPYAFAAGGQPGWLPLAWHLFDKLPVLKNITPANFSAATTWFVAVIGAVLADRLWPAQAGERARSVLRRVFGEADGQAALRVAAAGVVGIALAVPWLLSWPLPFTTTSVAAPAAVTRYEAGLSASSVVLLYPFPSSYIDHSLVWQAESKLRFKIVGGRGIATLKNGTADHGFTQGTLEGTMTALTTAQIPRGSLALPPLPNAATIASFRAALRRDGVTNVVMTGGGRNPGYARHWLTVAIGAPPQRVNGLWTWANVQQLIS